MRAMASIAVGAKRRRFVTWFSSMGPLPMEQSRLNISLKRKPLKKWIIERFWLTTIGAVCRQKGGKAPVLYEMALGVAPNYTFL
ncbi:hypothetical protein [Phyllobacterium salinisoli]|uniref:hypothetical protein n=1 Tax=Phyllobacterium salinisoli TaxID=1899321 RepID=UPI0011C0623C|nr:hypothetical protein [Phyllobacterium salinisoli]